LPLTSRPSPTVCFVWLKRHCPIAARMWYDPRPAPPRTPARVCGPGLAEDHADGPQHGLQHVDDRMSLVACIPAHQVSQWSGVYSPACCPISLPEPSRTLSSASSSSKLLAR
jgi:hypothetical protein